MTQLRSGSSSGRDKISVQRSHRLEAARPWIVLVYISPLQIDTIMSDIREDID